MDDPEGEVRVAGDDVVDHRGDPALEIGIGGLHDDGDVDVHVHAVLGNAVGQHLLVDLGLRLLRDLKQLGRADRGLLVGGLLLGGLLGQGDRGGVGGGRGHGLPGDGRGLPGSLRDRLSGDRGLGPVRLLRDRLDGDRGLAVHRGRGGLRGRRGCRGRRGIRVIGGR